ncbi:MAG: MXAN_5187 C-terminal domain-containing protein [Terriglobia bacterium]
MTVDEDFNKLEDDLRRLKIEYEVYFNGASPRPPRDTLFRVENTIKKYSSDQSMLNFSQRFRFTSLAQKYAVNSNLWRRKLQEKEEGRSATGPHKHPKDLTEEDGTVRVVCSDPDVETEKVSQLLQAMVEARMQTGERAEFLDLAAFHKFIKDKTQQVKEKLGCDKVLFSISVEEGKVKFKATKAE